MIAYTAKYWNAVLEKMLEICQHCEKVKRVKAKREERNKDKLTQSLP